LALWGLCIAYLTRLTPSETSTVEQLLPPEKVQEIVTLRQLYGDAGDIVLVMASFAPPTASEGTSARTQRLRDLESALGHVEGVRRTLSATSRPRLTYEGGAFHLEPADTRSDGDPRLARFFAPDESTSVIVVALNESAATLSGARHIAKELEAVAARASTQGVRVRTAGSPMLRVATWEAGALDARRIVPVLALVAVVVPWLFFRSFMAVLFPLVLGAFATTATFVLHRIFVGAASPWLLVLLPIVWSVATMDAMHLYEATRHCGDVRAARQRLTMPCLVTALTTATSLVVLGAPAGPALFRNVGLWAAIGTALAYAFTFALAGPLLRLASNQAPLPTWPARWAAGMVLTSARRPKATLLAWALLLGLATAALPQLHVASRYPNVFARGAGGSTEESMQTVAKTLGVDLAPLEIHLEAQGEHDRSPERLIASSMALGQYLATLPETRLSLSASTLVEEWLQREPTRALELRTGVMGPSHIANSAAGALTDPRVAAWIQQDRGVTRTLVLLAPTTFARRRELFGWIEHYVRTVLPGYRVRLSGPAYLYHAAEEQGVAGVFQGALLDLGLLALTFLLVFRRASTAIIAVIVNAAPVLVLLGGMAALGVPWSLGLMGVPVIVFGLAVDDTIHLLWAERGRAGKLPLAAYFARSVRHSAAAVLSTCALLAGSLGSLSRSGFQVNHELGLLLPLGLGIALAAELTLLPALLRVARARPKRG